VLKGIDYDVKPMLKPFIEAGAVTYVSYDQNSRSDHMANAVKNANSAECWDRFGGQADWLSLMDTDEVFYIEKAGEGAVGMLNDMLT
jgi:hypothetical protein